MSSAVELSDLQLEVLDIAFNLEPLTIFLMNGLRTREDSAFDQETLNACLDLLSKQGLISIAKDQYQTIITINAASRNLVRDVLTNYWKRTNVGEATLRAQAEKNLLGTMRMLEFKYDDKPHIGFSDYLIDAESQRICNAMARAGLFFKNTWSSRKHSYESYYLRKFPFDAEKILEQIIIERINPKDVEVQHEWPMVVMTLYSNNPVRIEDLRENFPDLTSGEVDELLAKLEERSVLSRSRGEITIPKATRELLKSYFLFNQYTLFKSAMLLRLRRRVAERPSNLFLIGLVRKALASASPVKTSEPFCSIKRELLANFSEHELKEACKLGVLFLTTKEAIIAQELVTELESVLKSALTVETFMTVPPNDNLAAMRAWFAIFGQCKEYAKIWDEYINEETLEIIDRFCQKDLSITILSALRKSREIDLEESEQRVKEMRNSGRKINFFFVGDLQQGNAPFHKRYVISKDTCYLLTSSIKEIGKSKGVDVVSISNPIKAGEVEPAFDYWTGPLKKLQDQGYMRIDEFQEWIGYLRKQEAGAKADTVNEVTI
jgi:DNA-binding MarR family transcriptional regulator